MIPSTCPHPGTVTDETGERCRYCTTVLAESAAYRRGRTRAEREADLRERAAAWTVVRVSPPLSHVAARL